MFSWTGVLAADNCSNPWSIKRYWWVCGSAFSNWTCIPLWRQERWKRSHIGSFLDRLSRNCISWVCLLLSMCKSEVLAYCIQNVFGESWIYLPIWWGYYVDACVKKDVDIVQVAPSHSCVMKKNCWYLCWMGGESEMVKNGFRRYVWSLKQHFHFIIPIVGLLMKCKLLLSLPLEKSNEPDSWNVSLLIYYFQSETFVIAIFRMLSTIESFSG